MSRGMLRSWWTVLCASCCPVLLALDLVEGGPVHSPGCEYLGLVRKSKPRARAKRGVECTEDLIPPGNLTKFRELSRHGTYCVAYASVRRSSCQSFCEKFGTTCADVWDQPPGHQCMLAAQRPEATCQKPGHLHDMLCVCGKLPIGPKVCSAGGFCGAICADDFTFPVWGADCQSACHGRFDSQVVPALAGLCSRREECRNGSDQCSRDYYCKDLCKFGLQCEKEAEGTCTKCQQKCLKLFDVSINATIQQYCDGCYSPPVDVCTTSGFCDEFCQMAPADLMLPGRACATVCGRRIQGIRRMVSNTFCSKGLGHQWTRAEESTICKQGLCHKLPVRRVGICKSKCRSGLNQKLRLGGLFEKYCTQCGSGERPAAISTTAPSFETSVSNIPAHPATDLCTEEGFCAEICDLGLLAGDCRKRCRHHLRDITADYCACGVCPDLETPAADSEHAGLLHVRAQMSVRNAPTCQCRGSEWYCRAICREGLHCAGDAEASCMDACHSNFWAIEEVLENYKETCGCLDKAQAIHDVLSPPRRGRPNKDEARGGEKEGKLDYQALSGPGRKDSDEYSEEEGRTL